MHVCLLPEFLLSLHLTHSLLLFRVHMCCWTCLGRVVSQVLVTHGGVEMGQGLHTKMAQVAAHELGVPVSQVFIAETSTDKVRVCWGFRFGGWCYMGRFAATYRKPDR